MGVLLTVAMEFNKSVRSAYYMQNTRTLESYKLLRENCVYI